CPSLAVAPTPPPVQDACGNTITPVPGTAPTPSVCEEDMVYTFTYTDCAGNTDVWTYTYHIVMREFTLPADEEQTVNCPSLAVAPTPPPVQDACGNTITPVPGTAPTPSVCEEDMVYTFTYTDCAGNTDVWTYTYHIVMPEFTLPADEEQTVNCPSLAVAPTPPPVQDACGNTITPVPGTAPTPSVCEEDMVYTFTYTDCAGNTDVWT